MNRRLTLTVQPVSTDETDGLSRHGGAACPRTHSTRSRVSGTACLALTHSTKGLQRHSTVPACSHSRHLRLQSAFQFHNKPAHALMRLITSWYQRERTQGKTSLGKSTLWKVNRGRAGWLVTGRLLVRSPAPPSRVWRCP